MPCEDFHPGLPRRQWLQAGLAVWVLGRTHLAWGASLLAVRVWPAAEYTRVTLESDTALQASQSFIPSPPRLAIDIQGLELNSALREWVGKVRPDDPNIAGVRVGQNSPGVVRLVIDLNSGLTTLDGRAGAAGSGGGGRVSGTFNVAKKSVN